MPIDNNGNPFVPNVFNLPGNAITGRVNPIEYYNGAIGPKTGAAGVPGSNPNGLANSIIVTEAAGNEFPPVNSLPFSIFQRVLVTLQPIADSEQIDSQVNVERANRVPLEMPAVDTLDNNDWTTLTNGMGEAAGLTLPPGNAAILDSFGVTVFSELADFDILWSIGVGISDIDTIAPIKVLLPQTRGWRYGTAEQPVKLGGNRVVFSKDNSLRVSVFALNSATTAGSVGIWKPTAHYVELSLNGWLVPNMKVLPGSQSFSGGGAFGAGF